MARRHDEPVLLRRAVEGPEQRAAADPLAASFDVDLHAQEVRRQVVVLIGRDRAGAHDLVRMARQGRVYASAAESHYYGEPKRLAKPGYLTAEKQPGRPIRARTTA